MDKYKEAQIKPYQFDSLQGEHIIERKDFKPFSFSDLKGETVNKIKATDDSIRVERTLEKKHNFKIDEIVRDYRGLSKQEQNDLEKRINDEVVKRTQAAYQEAYEAGKKEGFDAGKIEALQSHQGQLEQHVDEFAKIVHKVSIASDKILLQNKTQIQEFINRFTKWILLKEINEDLYLNRLFEKLVLEINSRKNLVVKVGKDNFKQMPEVISAFEARFGQLTNVRIEIVPEINYPGIVLETENGLIDGSMEGIFSNIDKIFEQMLTHE